MQGRDIADLYLPKLNDGKTALERKPWREEFFYKFTFLDERFIASSNVLVRKMRKLIDWYYYKRFQLFDIEKHPLELYDVIDDPVNAEVVSAMKKLLSEIHDGLKGPKIGCNKGGDSSVKAPDEEAINREEEAKKVAEKAKEEAKKSADKVDTSSNKTSSTVGEVTTVKVVKEDTTTNPVASTVGTVKA